MDVKCLKMKVCMCMVSTHMDYKYECRVACILVYGGKFLIPNFNLL